MDTTYPLAALDFTSAPSRQKPIIAMEGLLHVECDQWRLELTGFSQFITWPDWETWLSQTSALLGIDAPLGLPDAFLRHHGLTSMPHVFNGSVIKPNANGWIPLKPSPSATQPGTSNPSE